MNDTPSPRWQPLVELALPALTVLFGLQTLRVLIPLVVYHYGVQPGVTTIGMGLYALVVFLAAFLVAVVRRLLGPRPMLLLTASGVALLRLAEQLSTNVGLDLLLTTAGTVLFLFFLAVYLGHARGQRERGTGVYALGLLLGLALDTAIQGAAGTYDLSWQPGLLTNLTVLALVLVQLVLLVWFVWRAPAPDKSRSDTGFLAALPFLALGPLLMLQVLVFQNVARLATVTGWPPALAFGWVVLGSALALALATALVARGQWGRWPLALLLGVGLVAALVLDGLGGLGAALGVLVGQVCGAGLLTLVLLQQGARADRPGLWRTAIVHGLGMLLFVLLAFVYYANYDLGFLPDSGPLLYIAGVIVGLCALGATASPPLIGEGPGERLAPGWLSVGIALALLILPLVSFATWRAPQPAAGKGWPVRVMTYNLHQGFDTDGWLGMEALAQQIEQQRPDVVILNEVSRGWYINGSVDILSWLSQRLGMPYVFGPAADPVWGSAILSRYPINEHGTGMLPQGEPMKRGYLWARLDVGGGQELLVIASHLHQWETDHDIHVRQVNTLLDFWARRPQTIVLGDLNSWPDSPEMGLFRAAGFLDSFAELGKGDGFTWPSYAPFERIDYIWHTPDLKVSDYANTQGTATDHMGVAVTLTR